MPTCINNRRTNHEFLSVQTFFSSDSASLKASRQSVRLSYIQVTDFFFNSQTLIPLTDTGGWATHFLFSTKILTRHSPESFTQRNASVYQRLNHNSPQGLNLTLLVTRLPWREVSPTPIHPAFGDKNNCFILWSSSLSREAGHPILSSHTLIKSHTLIPVSDPGGWTSLVLESGDLLYHRRATLAVQIPELLPDQRLHIAVPCNPADRLPLNTYPNRPTHRSLHVAHSTLLCPVGQRQALLKPTPSSPALGVWGGGADNPSPEGEGEGGGGRRGHWPFKWASTIGGGDR